MHVFHVILCLTVTLNRWLRFCFVHTFFLLFANIIRQTHIHASQPNQRWKNKKRTAKKGQILMLYGIFHVLDHLFASFKKKPVGFFVLIAWMPVLDECEIEKTMLLPTPNEKGKNLNRFALMMIEIQNKLNPMRKCFDDLKLFATVVQTSFWGWFDPSTSSFIISSEYKRSERETVAKSFKLVKAFSGWWEQSGV